MEDGCRLELLLRERIKKGSWGPGIVRSSPLKATVLDMPLPHPPPE